MVTSRIEMFLSCKETLPEYIDIIYINYLTCVNEPLVCLLTVGRKNTIFPLYTVQAFVQTDEPVTNSSQAEGRANTTVH